MDVRRQSNTFQFEEDASSKNAEGISNIYQEVLLKMKVLPTKPDVKSLNNDIFMSCFILL